VNGSNAFSGAASNGDACGETLTVRESFLALSDFVWRRSRVEAENLLSLVGDTALQADGEATDPAAWEDWLGSVERIRLGQPPRHAD